MNNKQPQDVLMKNMPMTTSGKITIVALVGMAVDELVSVLILEGEHPPIALVIELILLALAALVATRRWWASALATALSGLFMLFTVSGSVAIITQPRNPGFISALVFVGLALVAVVAGTRTTFQNYQHKNSVPG